MEQVVHEGAVIAIIIRADFQKDGIEFFTPDDFSQQIAYMKRPAGYKIPAHTHNEVQRKVTRTLETLFVRRGRMRVDLYSENEKFIETKELRSGDVILLVSGGHGFQMFEETELIEVKQGPYAGDQDKKRFKGVEK